MGSLQSDFVKSVKEPRQQRHEDYDADLLANEIDGIVIHEYNYPCNRPSGCRWYLIAVSCASQMAMAKPHTKPPIP